MAVDRIIICVLGIMIFSCGHTTKEAPRKKMVGVNGEAIYVFNKADTIATVYKQEYFGPDFQVIINEDTIALGSFFISHLNVPHSNFEILISSPTSQIIREDSTFGDKEYRYKPDHIGTYDFRGVIKYDSVSAPFEYKFVVIDK